MSDWRQEINERLAQRDEVESRYHDIMNSYSQIVQRALAAEEELDKSRTSEEKSKFQQLEQQVADKTQSLQSITQRFDQLKNETISDKEYIKQLEQTVSQLQTSVSDYRSESSKKSTELQNLQDEFIVLQLSLNVSEAKSKKLEEENKNLVDRWMKKVAQEVDQMNDANAFLQMYGLLKLFLETPMKISLTRD